MGPLNPTHHVFLRISKLVGHKRVDKINNNSRKWLKDELLPGHWKQEKSVLFLF